MELNNFLTIKESKSIQIKVKGSIFIATIFNVSSVSEANDIIHEINNKYKDATHNVPSYRIYDEETHQIIERAIDDGEPSGTAGKPILDVIKHKELVNVLIIVTRYFGGTLLGTGGLVRAYQGSASDVIEASTLVNVALMNHYKIKTNYDSFSSIKKILDSEKILYNNVSYNLEIDFDVYVDKSKEKILDKIRNEYYNNVIINRINTVYM